MTCEHCPLALRCLGGYGRRTFCFNCGATTVAITPEVGDYNYHYITNCTSPNAPTPIDNRVSCPHCQITSGLNYICETPP